MTPRFKSAFLLLLTAVVFPAIPSLTAAPAAKVFILAGQSNMEGKATNTLFDYQATASDTKDFFAHLRKDGKWIVRDDAFIKFLDRKGPLTLGYGSPGRTGPEYEFGCILADRFTEPVILIKTAWGGHSLAKNFRPPSAGLPDAMMQQDLKNAVERVKKHNEKNQKTDPLPTLDDIKKQYGTSYRNMMEEVQSVIRNPGALFPELGDTKAELAGFVWFQGWNDQYNGYEAEYQSNMQHLINDVRRDLNAAKLPFVIAAMGQNGSKPASGPMLTIRDAQLAMQDVAEFKGNVKSFRTDLLVDKEAEVFYPKWKENLEEWRKRGDDHAYHYFGSAIWFTRIGKGMADAMLELLPTK
jgi:alpha-galactosidase